TDALIEQLSADPSTAEQRVAQAAARRTAPSASSGVNPFTVFIIFVFVVLMIRSVLGGGRRRSGLGGLAAPIIFGSGLGGGWGRGDWGGGGGGGFGGGGGGSFGGGGSSGSW
ncbi:MAG TPA: methanol dehydrogenase, partial [Caulobacteraceae bacterium]|nr:methanol dehydrogenase [Caulobacteraceae bacterium]